MAIMNDSERFAQCTPSCWELHLKLLEWNNMVRKPFLTPLLGFDDGEADIYGCLSVCDAMALR